MGQELLSDAAAKILDAAKHRLGLEGRKSAYVFPRLDAAADRPIVTVRRFWLKTSKAMGWDGLPLSHVVLRHHPRNTPSYLYMERYLLRPTRRRETNPTLVSKLVGKFEK